MTTANLELIRQRAIENIERLALDAIAAISSSKNTALGKKLVERAEEVGLAQTAAELAYSGLVACKTPVRPDSIELVVEVRGYNHDKVTERKSAAAARSMVRRIKDNY